MKIGIITFWQSHDNYGQLLQCWALQQYLKQLGHEPFLIRYSFYKKFTLLQLARKIAKSILTPSNVKQKEISYVQKNRIRCFNEFRDKHIKQTEIIYHSISDLQRNPPEATAYIVGSDQIWNPFFLKYKHYSAYWLDFGDDKVKRIAYAASYGTDECPPSLQGKLMRQLARFDAISVREESGIAISAEAGRQAAHVLDPTLLLSMDDYFTLTANVPARKSPYIYIYSINIANKEDIRWSEFCTFATEQHFSPIVTPASGYLPGRELFEDVEYCYATIPQWISLIQHSKLVVTTSFHGVVFSILLHKHFVYFPLSGTNSKGNSRVLNLLSKVGLSECVWREKGDYYRIYNLCIDWINVEKCLSDLRLCSYIFLKKGLA